MDENVVIKISGLQIVENTGDNVEVIAKGKHYLKKDQALPTIWRIWKWRKHKDKQYD